MPERIALKIVSVFCENPLVFQRDPDMFMGSGSVLVAYIKLFQLNQMKRYND